VAVTLQRADEAEVAALARRWGCARLWGTTLAAIADVLEGAARSAAVALWARHLRGVRERTVLESHLESAVAPVWGLPRRRIPAALVAEVRATVAPNEAEPWGVKLRRGRVAVRNAGTARSDHLLALGAQGDTSIQGPEAG
jgi:hypothetical protein